MKKFAFFVLIAWGLVWAVYALQYDFWIRQGPAGGLLPFIAGLATVVVAILMVLNKKNVERDKFDKKLLLPIAVMIFIVIGSYLIGLILSLALYTFFWAKIIEKQRTLSSILVAVIWPAILYIVFGYILQVRLPMGILFSWL